MSVEKRAKDAAKYTKGLPLPVIAQVHDPIDVEYDALVIVCDSVELALDQVLSQLTGDAAEQFRAALAVDKAIGKETAFIAAPAVPGGRLVLAPTGNLNRHIDDVRRVAEAAGAPPTLQPLQPLQRRVALRSLSRTFG